LMVKVIKLLLENILIPKNYIRNVEKFVKL
jgi:hypothetical protein